MPKAVVREPSDVFNLAAVGCMGVLKLSSMFLLVEYQSSDMAAPESINGL